MKTYLVVAGVFLGAMMMAIPDVGEAAGTCIERLTGKSYTCEAKDSDGGGTFASTLRYGPSTSSDAQLVLFPGTDAEVPCACDTTGTFKNPKFKASRTKWTCANTEEGVAFSIRGNVGPKGKITKVSAIQTNGSEPSTLIFDCTLNASAPEAADADEDEEE